MTPRTFANSSLGLSLALSMSAIILWSVLVRVVTETYTAFSSSGFRTTRHLVYDGEEPLIYMRRINVDGVSRAHTELDGTPRNTTNLKQSPPTAHLPSPRRVGWAQMAYSKNNRVRILGEDQTHAEIWYLMHDGTSPGGAWLENYSTVTKRRTRCIGLEGEVATTPLPEQRFRMRLQDTIHNTHVADLRGLGSGYDTSGRDGGIFYLATADSIHLVDLNSGAVTPVCATPQDFESVASSWMGRPEAKWTDRANEEFTLEGWNLFVRTTHSVIRMSAKGLNPSVISLPNEIRSWPYLRYMLRGEGRRARIHASWSDRNANYSDVRGKLFDVTADGNLRETDSYAWRNDEEGLPESSLELAQAVNVPCPALMVGTMVTSKLFGESYSRRRLFLSTIAALISSTIGVILCVRHQASHNAGNRFSWRVFVFLFGLFGYFGYRFHRKWLPIAWQINAETIAVSPTVL